MPLSPVSRCAIALVGVGSPIGNDNLGWQAIDWLEQSDLRERFPDLHITFERADRPGALLLKYLRGIDAAIIIDAMQAGSPPGTVRAFTAEQVLTQTAGLCSSHAFGVAETLALGASLGELPRRMAIMGIEMGDGANEDTFSEGTTHQLYGQVEEWLISI